MLSDIVLLDVDCCDPVVLGIIQTWFRDQWPRKVITTYDFLIDSRIKLAVATDCATVVVMISRGWERLFGMRASARLCKLVKPGTYICGMCLAGIPDPLTELPNFTIHAGPDLYEGLLFDINRIFDEREKDDKKHCRCAGVPDSKPEAEQG